MTTTVDWSDDNFVTSRRWNGIIKEDGYYFQALMKSLKTDPKGVRQYLSKHRQATVGF